MSIKVDAATLRDQASDVKSTADDVMGQIADLLGRIENLVGGEFTGAAADAYATAFAEMKQGQDEIGEGFTSMGDFLSKIADEFENLDTNFASQL